jgi:hypothetical protein
MSARVLLAGSYDALRTFGAACVAVPGLAVAAGGVLSISSADRSAEMAISVANGLLTRLAEERGATCGIVPGFPGSVGPGRRASSSRNAPAPGLAQWPV